MKQEYSLISSAPKPFVKWAGGKRQLLPIITKYVPQKFERYFEPFLGGGAVFFNLAYKRRNAKWLLSDLNSDLVLSYVTIRDRVKELISALESHSTSYFKNQSSYYYKIRESEPKGQIEKVSRLLFLNKTCFNGLYRVNSKGKFNVPLGKYVNPNIVSKENLIAVSEILQSRDISIKCQDFESALKNATEGDFVYLDPPYHPVSETSNFTSYTNGSFDYGDQERLYAKFKALDKKGVNILLSNSKSEEIVDLFKEFSDNVIEINANRFINSVSQRRTGHTELLIKNY
ncbi:MAG TPA: DNA adenine methylase [Candidatus Nitrosotalea sp.]|nr:DNA adenine methylase [Candidatus Nitrosotalea sp.]